MLSFNSVKEYIIGYPTFIYQSCELSAYDENYNTIFIDVVTFRYTTEKLISNVFI